MTQPITPPSADPQHSKPCRAHPSWTTCGVVALMALAAAPLAASEHLLGYIHGAEPLPEAASEIDLSLTHRSGKGEGSYQANDLSVGYEYGFTSRFTAGAELKGTSVKTSGLIIDGYVPEEKSLGMTFSGLEAGLQYNILSAAKDGLGLTAEFAFEWSTIDPHSGQDKSSLSAEYGLALQSYFMDGQVVWMANTALESTIADRAHISGLDPAVEWPTDPEVEIEMKIGTGISYRFAAGWFIGAEILYETEFETEVFQERDSLFAGPSLHYANQRWWITATWLPQIVGGGEKYAGQTENLHLIEKTEQEFRLRFGYNL
jgi:hypothetical protein